jgi:triphosphoribosyl-dephospho-CoA synthase
MWDDELKSRGINPGTTADLTVAALLIAGLTAPAQGAG